MVLARANKLSAEGKKKETEILTSVSKPQYGANMCQPQQCQGCLLRERWGFAQSWCSGWWFWEARLFISRTEIPLATQHFSTLPWKLGLCNRGVLCCLWGMQCHGLLLHHKGGLRKICPCILSPRLKVSLDLVSPSARKKLMEKFV